MNTWVLIVFFLGADGLPTLPITITPQLNQRSCTLAKIQAIKVKGAKAVCRELDVEEPK